jgi:CheY-like chemotaxis protein
MPRLLSHPPFSPPAARLSVVVADDVAELRQLVALWLEELGYAVSAAANGKEAFRLATEQPCDLVCTDILMPDGDGLDVIAEIRRARPHVRVLAFSGGDRVVEARNALRLAKGIGAHNWLPKPFNRVQFVDAVRRVVGTRGEARATASTPWRS